MAKRNERVSLPPTLRHPPAPPLRQEGRCHIVRPHGGKQVASMRNTFRLMHLSVSA